MARSSSAGTSQGHGRLILVLGVAVLLTVASALLDFGFILNAIGVERVNGSRGGQIVGAVIFLLIALGCSRWVIRIEHQLRGHTDVAKSYVHGAGSAPGSLGGSAPGRRGDSVAWRRGGSVAWRRGGSVAWRRGGSVAWSRYRTRRRFGPIGTAIVGLLYLGAAVGAVVGVVSSHSQADRSTFVQQHGIPITATIDHVANSESCGKSSCSYSAAVTVTLPAPIGGTRISIVHVPREFELIAGEPVPILVDPRQPNYSELPGLKFKRPGEWILLCFVAAFFLALAVLDARRLASMVGHRRAHAKSITAGPKTVY